MRSPSTLRLCRCRKCKGEKTIKEKKKAVWHIEKGMRDGSRIVLSEHGDQYVGPSGEPVFALSCLRTPSPPLLPSSLL